MNDRSKDKTSRPFYELPAHFKPCSKIIKEARMQLKYSECESVSNDNFPRHGSEYAAGGIRVMQTKRPFTPRDSSNLWGSSASKRPPSAITLSRLSLDEIDEGSSSRLGSSAKQRVFNSSIHQRLSLDLSNTSEAEIQSRADITRTKFKSLSLLNGDDDKWKNADIDGSGDSFASANLTEQEGPYTQINSLEVAVEYLDCFVENSTKKGQPPKSDVIAILKIINSNISNINVLEKLKSRLLKLLFKLVEKNQSDEDVLFWSSFILLHCQIVGHNLTTVYKMIFKASKSKDYLDTIKESDYLQTFLESFGQICPFTQTESMIYGYGILKFICSEDYILVRVIDLKLIEIMTIHLKALNEEIEQNKGVASENIQNAVFQLTSILRSIVGLSSSLDNVASSGLLEEVCNSLAYTMRDADVLSNIVRILSVVSEQDSCGQVIAENSNLCGVIVKILQMWHTKEDIIVRLMYSLGNILGKYPDMRIKFYNESLSYQMIIQLIFYYMENVTPASEDILVKSVRLLANWSLDADIGADFSDEKKLSKILNKLLTSETCSNELLVCTIGTLNNISYYKDYSSLDEISKKTAEAILGYLSIQDVELRTEVTKVLGNLTRNAEVRKACSDHIGTLLLSLEESDENPDLLCAAIGVLINIIADEDCKREFVRKQGLHYLIDLLERTQNVRLALMISQLLWNLILSTTRFDDDGNEHSYFHKEEMNELSQAILKKMQEYSGESQGESDRQYLEACQDFLSISSNLYDKLNSD